MSSSEEHHREASNVTWSINEDPITNFSPSRSPSQFNLIEFEKSIEEMKLVIRRVEGLKESLVLIDCIQRLGLEHYFREQVEITLKRHYVGFDPNNYPTLKETSLLFRLLRQGGHFVPTDENGRFHEILAKDTNGLMELYEASQLDTGKEEILLEAVNFTSKHLFERVKNFDDCYEVVSNNTLLEYPSQKSLTKFTARRFLKDLRDIYPWINSLKKLAKLDFVIVQQSIRLSIIVHIVYYLDFIMVYNLSLIMTRQGDIMFGVQNFEMILKLYFAQIG